MKVTIIPNLTRSAAREITEKICSVLREMDVECCIPRTPGDEKDFDGDMI